MRNLFAFLITCIFPLSASAADVIDNDDDQVLNDLRAIFGDVVSFLTNESVPGSEEIDSVLGALSFTFNQVVFSLVILFTAFSSLKIFFSAIHDGKIDAQRYDSSWYIARILTAFCIVTPVIAGYSIYQIAVLYIAGSGSQIATDHAIVATEQIRKTGSMIKLTPNDDYEQILFDILQSKVCRYGFNAITDDENIIEKPIRNNDLSDKSVGVSQAGKYSSLMEAAAQSAIATASFSYKTPTYFDEDSPCGSFKITFSEVQTSDARYDVLRNYYLEQYIDILNEVSINLDVLAKSISEDAINNTNSIVLNNMFNDILESYKTSHQSLVNHVGSSAYDLYLNAAQLDSQAPFVPEDEVKNYGWPYFGSLYLRWSQIGQAASNLVSEVQVETNTTISNKVKSNYDMKAFFIKLDEYLNKNRYVYQSINSTQAKNLKSKYTPVTSHLASEQTEKELELQAEQLKEKGEAKAQAAKEKLDYLKNSVIDFIVSPEGDPLTIIITFGNKLLNYAEVMKAVKIGLDIVKEVIHQGQENLRSSATSFFGSGWLGMVATGVKVIVSDLSTTIFSFILMATVIGSVASFYIPTLPLIHWLIGIVNYYVSIIEAFVVGPLVALTKTTAEGKGLITEHSRAAYMLIFTIYFRPTMNIFGLIAGVIITSVVGYFALLIFATLFADLLRNSNLWFLDWFITTAILLSFMVTLITRSFGLISEFGDKVSRYIGGSVESYNDQGAISKNEQNFNMYGNIFQTGVGGADKQKSR